MITMVFSIFCLVATDGLERRPHEQVSVRYESEQLADLVEAESASVSSSGRFSRIQLSLVNTSRRDQQISYRVEWLDIDGEETGAVSAWRTLTIYANGRERITSVGQSSSAFQAAVSIGRPQ